MKVLVCGGRDFHDREMVSRVLWAMFGDTITTIIHGGAEGADRCAHDYALAHGIPIWEFQADWRKHGRAAGPIRNQRMLDIGQPQHVVAFPGSKGTANMVALARAAGVEVTCIS